MSPEATPRRISDADRDAAVEMLRQHFELGRLDPSEFEQRMGAALTARVAADLDPLFVDLPDPRPGSDTSVVVPWTAPPPPATTSSEFIRWAKIINGVVWPVAILAALMTGGNWWLFILIALVTNTVLGGIIARHRTPPPEINP